MTHHLHYHLLASHMMYQLKPSAASTTSQPQTKLSSTLLSTSRAIGLLNLWRTQTGSRQGSLSLDGIVLLQHIDDFARPSRMAHGNEMCPCLTRTVSLLFFFCSEALLLDTFITDSHGLLDYRLSNMHHTQLFDYKKNL